MGERKGQSKYYPPDFDPTRLPAQQRTYSHKVRMMMPMSVQCVTCAEFIYTGKKFNAVIEPANEAYLGIKIWRLTVRCPKCAQAICLKTDPQTCDYVCESGATRNFEPWREYNQETAEMNAEREDARKDVMKDLEAKQYDSKKEMEALNQLDQLVSMSARRTNLSPDDLLSFVLDRSQKEELDAAEEAEVSQFKELQKTRTAPKPDLAAPPATSAAAAAAAGGGGGAMAVALVEDGAVPSHVQPHAITLRKKRKRKPEPGEGPGGPPPPAKPAAPQPGGLGLGLDYASDDGP
nr:Splicing factor YJU2 [Euglena gracilis]